MYKYYYVYILKCADDSYYIGVTNNINHRLNQHIEGTDTNCYTFNKRPVKLAYHEEFVDINAAIRREKQLKGWNRTKKEALISAAPEKLPKLSERKTPQERNMLREPQHDSP